MSANIWIDTDHNNLYASDKLLCEVLKERREHDQKSILEIPEKDFQKQIHSAQKQPHGEIEKLITSEFTIDLITLGKPVLTELEHDGENSVIYQKIPFECDPVLLEYSPVAAGPIPPIASTKKQTPARGPIGKIIKSKNSSNCGEIEVKLIIKGDVIYDDNIMQKIEAKFKNNLDRIKKWAGYANEEIADSNRLLSYNVDQPIRARMRRLKRIEEINQLRHTEVDEQE